VIGRADERALLEGLLADGRSGRSGTLVLVGEAGVGKSVVLSHAMGLSDGFLVLRATGVESEVDLAFAGLHELLRPVLHLADRLTGPQAEALQGALGLADHTSHDRYLVGVAVLSLLSEAAEDSPVLCVVEDAHWLDVPSVEAIAFAARRLHAEGVVVLAATRGERWPGLPGRRITVFGPDDAAQLLCERTDDVADDVCDRLVRETGGNALALVEFAASLTPAQLAGREPLPRMLAFSDRVEDAFLGRVRSLPPESRTLLLVAAADDTRDPTVVWRAGRELGIGADALEAAEHAGVAKADGSGRIEFRHPLVRAAVYQAATLSERIGVHQALVQALDGAEHAERRAWHLAASAISPDETIAGDLEHAAQRARRRGGYAVASTTYERAAELSVVVSHRARLTVAAAQAAFQAGQLDRATGLSDRARRLVEDHATRDEVAVLKGRIEFARGSSLDAYTLLLSAARGMAMRDPRAAVAVLVEAARAAWNANDLGRHAEATELLAALPRPPGDPLSALVSTTLAASDLAAGRIADAVTKMREGTDAWLPLAATGRVSVLDAEVGQASLAHAGFTRVTGDDEVGLKLGTSIVAECRSHGLAARLPYALVHMAMTETLAGRHSAAAVNATEGLRLASDLGQPIAVCGCESVLAWLAAVRGDQDRCRKLADHAVELSERHELAAIAAVAIWALGLLELSLGRPEQAVDRLLDRTHGPLTNPATRLSIVPDLVEATTRARRRADEVREPLASYEQWARCTGQPWAEAAVHRCHAMLADQDAQTHFEEALRLHEQAGPAHRPFDRARTQLLYGEWLRRARRKAEARPQLTAARETFERLGATPWSDRAGNELRATGQTVSRSDPARVRLTPQEAQVVRLVAEGGTNQDVAARLFISPRTVAYHLYNAFPKLGVASRTDIARLDLEELITTDE
jgi:DNA-binding CsgD family transcriptional regulator